MKIEKYFDKQLKLFRWRVDVTINGQRVRKGKFATRDEATKFVIGLQAISRFEQWGLPLPQSATSVFEFVEMARLKSTQQMQRLALFDHPHSCLLHFDCVGDFGASATKLHRLGGV